MRSSLALAGRAALDSRHGGGAPFAPRPHGPARRLSRAPAPKRELNIALCVPLGGSAGIWGPSALACAELAVAELNAAGGMAGRACRLVTVNAADDAPAIESTLLELVAAGDVDALVGMHTSAVRQRIVRALSGRLPCGLPSVPSVPFVYTPLYEGGETTPGVFAIGETLDRQLRPAIRWLSAHRQPRRWLAVGNDYVWPRAAHAIAREALAQAGAELVDETFVPVGTSDYCAVIERLRSGRIDAVLVSLIGQDAVDFNRAFGRAGLSRSTLRLSCAIGENELLGIGAANADELYVACGYFASLNTDANLAFKQRYAQHFGARAPTLNTFGQSTYEGVHFLAALLDDGLRAVRDGAPLAYPSAREATYAGAGVNHAPIYLARAEGNAFRVLTRL